ncbi:hypothetical protein C0Q70_12808 [Pomacea canaliculata]|uniref:VWFA domain-containing protein n=1 Tax=Pomacea canaliculata TaxID=400727 RepID=A0A2T7P2J9_POMCA|nr:hypothetical protein C0Q70_12808 [Pomacea canaliculata]
MNRSRGQSERLPLQRTAVMIPRDELRLKLQRSQYSNINTTISVIAILKNMIADVVDALDDDEDFVSVITFGEETTVVCPLTKFEKKIRELDTVTRFSSKTNLSSAVLQAVDILHEAQSGER